MDLADAMANKLNAQYLLVSEPNKTAVKKGRWTQDNRLDAAICHVGQGPGITKCGYGDGFVWVEIQDLVVYSCYISPNTTLDAYESFINSLTIDLADKGTKKIILTGDFNAKSPMWGEAYEGIFLRSCYHP